MIKYNGNEDENEKYITQIRHRPRSGLKYTKFKMCLSTLMAEF